MKLSTKKFLSLWFIPPEGIESKLSIQQQQLIDFHMSSSSSSSSGLKKKRLPTFIPHVTLIGGIPISDCCTVEDDVLPLLQQPQQQQRIAKISWSDDQADEVAATSVVMRLADAFCNFGSVECKNFGGVECKFVDDDDDDDDVAGTTSAERQEPPRLAMRPTTHSSFVKERQVFAPRRQKEEMGRRKEEGGGVITNNDPDHSNNSSVDGGDNSNNNSNCNKKEKEEVWNQSCISIMERTDSFINAMVLADQVLLFPTTITTKRTATTIFKEDDPLVLSATKRHLKPPAGQPHYSFVYGNDASLISSLQPPPSSSSSSSSNNVSSGGGGMKKKNDDDLVLECPPPPDFISTKIAVMWTYPRSLEGVDQWREIGRFSLVEEEGVRSSGPRGNGSKRVRDGQGLSDREARPCARSRSATLEQGGGGTLPNKSDSIAARHDGLVYACPAASEQSQILR